MMLQDIVLYAISALLFARRAMCSKNKRDMMFLVAFIIAGVALALYEGASVPIMLEGILIFNGVVSSYHSKENYALTALAIFFILPFYMFSALLAQSLLLGFLSGSYFFLEANRAGTGKMEVKRDVIQIAFGLAFMLSLAKIPYLYNALFIIILILVGSAVGNYGVSNKKSAISRILYSFERKNAVLGQGAMWLALGVLAAISFLSPSQIAAVISAILIGDAVATLVGTSIRIPLPYNRKKSAAGTIAYFAFAAALSFPFVGYIGIATALVAALVESATKQIDDNFDTAVVLVVVIKLLSFAGLV
jgi:dolichol kinase